MLCVGMVFVGIGSFCYYGKLERFEGDFCLLWGGIILYEYILL